MNFILQKRNRKILVCMLVLVVAVGVFAPFGEHAAYAQQALVEKAVDGSAGKVFAWISEVLFKLSGSLLAVAGYLMDFSITASLDINNFAKDAVENGWTILRDVANITFIFILLYVALGTILQIGTVNAKQALVNVIIIAFLINFSLFFTQVIIDASNYLATFFYNNAVKITVNGAQSNLGEIFTAALGPNSLFGKDVFTSLTNTKAAVSFLIAAVAVLLAAFSFFSVAIMFIIRTAALVLLMVLSPVAFAAYILSDTKKYFSQWFDTLLKQAFFAPIYLLVIYVVLLIIVASPFHASKQPPLAAAINTATIAFESEPNTLTTAGAEDVITAPLGTPPDFTLASQNLAQTFGAESFLPPGAGTLASSGSLSYLSVFFSYFLIIFLINGALVIAKTLGGQTASLGTKWAGKGLGAAMGIGAFAARRTIGRGFAALSRSETLKNLGYERDEEGNLVAKSGFGGLAGRFTGRLALRGTETMGKSSFDVRGGKLGEALGAGAGVIGANFGKASGKGGFEAIRKEQVNKQMAIAKSLGEATFSREETARIKNYEKNISEQERILKTAEKGSSEEANARNAIVSYQDELQKLIGRGNVRMQTHAEDVERGRLSLLLRDPKTNREMAKRIRGEIGKTKEQKLQDQMAGFLEKIAASGSANQDEAGELQAQLKKTEKKIGEI